MVKPYTEAFNIAQLIQEELKDYPVLDEELCGIISLVHSKDFYKERGKLMCCGKIVIEREELPLDDKWTAWLWGFCDAIVDRFSCILRLRELVRMCSFRLLVQQKYRLRLRNTLRAVSSIRKIKQVGQDIRIILLLNVSDVCADWHWRIGSFYLEN